MLEYKEHRVKVGMKREPKDIFDEIEQETANFVRGGWRLEETVMDDFLEHIDLLFVREV